MMMTFISFKKKRQLKEEVLVQILFAAHSLSELSVHGLSHVRLFVTPRTVACQALLSMELFRQEYGMGCHFLFPGLSSSLLHLLHWQMDSLSLHHLGSWVNYLGQLLALPRTQFPHLYKEENTTNSICMWMRHCTYLKRKKLKTCLPYIGR